MTSSVAKSRKSLQEARNINDAEMFVQIKHGQEKLREQESRMKQLSSEGEMRSVKLFPNSLADQLFGEKGNILGSISEIIIPKSVEPFGDFSVRLQSDKKTCIIEDVCITTGGSIVCTDWKNSKLKKLDRSYNVIKHLDMPSTPECLCEVDSTQLAVTLVYDKKVQFVFQQPLKLGRCFTVGCRCQGIDCHDGKFYVCCGGGKSEGQGHIEVYDINGGLLRTFYEGLIKPMHIKAASDGELFVADIPDSSSKLFKVNTHDFSVSEIHIKALTEVGRFCRIGERQLCIPGYKSNNIVLISEDGELQQELLTVKDGRVKPYSVAFNLKQSQIVVSLNDSDVIKVYDVIT
jgi:hypothetical protein